MYNFTARVEELLSEIANAAGTAFGPAASGSYGNQFPSQNDNAYAPGDARIPSIIGARVKGKRKKKNKIPVQRRTFNIAL